MDDQLRPDADGTAGPDCAEEAFGEKTSAALLPMFLDFYRQEVAAEEDVHRTLPFFATALGLIVAALNYVAGQLPAWPKVRSACPAALSWTVVQCAWPVFLAMFLLTVAALLAGTVLVFLYLATNRRGYERIGPEPAHRRRALELRAYHMARHVENDDLDVAVSRDLRYQLVEDLAAVIPINRRLTLQRYKWRARAVTGLLLALLCALAATMSMTAVSKSGFLQ